ncbi:hypothetical protein LBMAG20_00080 [Methylocystaceae bacterium]|nr:hypothetical protein LBMAG20_00080 [Methylocystaceae bacterium]
MTASPPAFTLKLASFLVCTVSGLVFAGHIYFNLGDYTAERGLVAFGQSLAIILAFAAMIYLIVETLLLALSRLFDLGEKD